MTAVEQRKHTLKDLVVNTGYSQRIVATAANLPEINFGKMVNGEIQHPTRKDALAILAVLNRLFLELTSQERNALPPELAAKIGKLQLEDVSEFEILREDPTEIRLDELPIEKRKNVQKQLRRLKKRECGEIAPRGRPRKNKGDNAESDTAAPSIAQRIDPVQAFFKGFLPEAGISGPGSGSTNLALPQRNRKLIMGFLLAAIIQTETSEPKRILENTSHQFSLQLLAADPEALADKSKIITAKFPPDLNSSENNITIAIHEKATDDSPDFNFEIELAPTDCEMLTLLMLRHLINLHQTN